MKAIVYGDISPNIIDGSSVWLASVTKVLAQVFDDVDVLLKFRLTTDDVLGEVKNIGNVNLIEPIFPDIEQSDSQDDPQQHTPESAKAQFLELQAERNYSTLIVRGFEACHEFCTEKRARGILWSYVTDLPFPPNKISERGLNRLRRIAVNSHRMFAQTESSRSYLEAIAPESAGKSLLIPPMIPDSAFALPENGSAGVDFESLQIVYSGKFAENWRTLELLDLPDHLLERGIESDLHIVGNKFQKSRTNPQWRQMMQDALENYGRVNNPRVHWHGGVSRSESIKVIASADIGIGWRTAELDSSLEISTKALEYGAASTAPIVNRTPDHELLYGLDYPLFSTANMTVSQLADLIAKSLPDIKNSQQKALRASRGYSMSAAVERWQNYTQHLRLRQLDTTRADKTPIRILIASHDLKFLGELLSYLQDNPSFTVTIDQWDTLSQHDEDRSRKLVSEADVVLCEWAGPNLVWYSNNTPDNVPIVCRLHGFELRNNASWLSSVNFDRVDQMCFVSDFYRRWAHEALPIDSNRTCVIPNSVDTDDLCREKLIESRFRLGLVGYVPFLKRPDRALDLLSQLITSDNRYTLTLKGRPPWEYPYVWNASLQQASYLSFYARIREDPALRNSVVFSPFSPDIGSWLRGIGIVLSPSEHESFHLAPAEGMSSGCIPIIWSREGASDIFPEHTIYQSVDDAASQILKLRDLDQFKQHSHDAITYARERWDSKVVCEKWSNLLIESVRRCGHLGV